MAEQQVNLTDLDPMQLQEVKKQLDQASRAREGHYDPKLTGRNSNTSPPHINS
jgi:hypothetical protein